MPEIKVPFYGHVRQNHSIQKELETAIHEVLESGQYVMGPALTRFEQESSHLFGQQIRGRSELGHRCPLARLHGAGGEAR